MGVAGSLAKANTAGNYAQIGIGEFPENDVFEQANIGLRRGEICAMRPKTPSGSGRKPMVAIR